MSQTPTSIARRSHLVRLILLVVVVGGAGGIVACSSSNSTPETAPQTAAPPPEKKSRYKSRSYVDLSGFTTVTTLVRPWPASASLLEVASAWHRLGYRSIERIDSSIARAPAGDGRVSLGLVTKATLLNYEGEPDKAYQVLEQARAKAESDPVAAEEVLYTIIFCQGVTALRRGETDNCVMCRGESSCILPINPAAVHTRPTGSRLAVRHFTEYLAEFPDDLEARWLLNIAHMTLGEHPHGVNPKYVISLDRFYNSEFDIGRFRDIGHLVKVNRLNRAGGAVMDDLDNDGLLDIVCSSMDPTVPLVVYKNLGNGTFEDRTERTGLRDQLGGLNLTHGDFDNDGNVDLFVVRGAWLRTPIRPSLLRNNGDGTFTDITEKSGLLDPVNSNSAAWADFDNDGHLDLFVACEAQPNRLFRNKGNGTFEEIAARAGVLGAGQMSKGCTWIDYDNDGYPDLFVNNLNGRGQLYHNKRDGRFEDVSQSLGIDGPNQGFACWAFDFDNDGWLDIWATCYDRTVEDVVKGLIGQPHGRERNRLFRNLGGKGFQDVTKEAGLDLVFTTMGCNYGDFDNDGYLDFYLGTGDPDFATVVPNRMFRNVGGKHFAEITGSSGTGHLQKGHGVACGDWDRDGNVDVFIEMGGAVDGDMYHNIMFQNPGQGNHWLTVKLVGKKSNRSALGARIKVVTAGAAPLTIHRHVSSGSSFGGNPLQQTIGLAKADRIAELVIHWPTSGTTQVFKDVAVNQAIEVTESAADYKKLEWKPIPVPK